MNNPTYTHTCLECFATVADADVEMHMKWHAHIDRMFDILAKPRPLPWRRGGGKR